MVGQVSEVEAAADNQKRAQAHAFSLNLVLTCPDATVINDTGNPTGAADIVVVPECLEKGSIDGLEGLLQVLFHVAHLSSL